MYLVLGAAELPACWRYTTFFEPGGKMVLAGGTALYAPVNALVDAAHTAHLPVFYTNQWLRPDDALFKKRIPHCLIDTWGARLVDAVQRSQDSLAVGGRVDGRSRGALR